MKLRLALLFVLVSLVMSFMSAAFAAAPDVVLNDSIVNVDASPSATQPMRAFVSSQVLTTTEDDAEMDFNVALKMRHFAELQERIGHKEQISQAEMVAKYEPTAADYQSVVDWLTEQGFTITFQDPSHIAVFARGKVNQLKKALKVSFAKVTSEKREYTSAVTAPSVPADLAPVLVGINGLQPHHHLHPTAIARPDTLTTTNPPYTPQQIQKAYNANTLINAGFTGGSQTMAVLNERILNTSDLTQFWTTYSVAQSISRVTTIQVGTVPTSTIDPDEYGEECLDAEWSSSIAPAANLRIYAWGKSSMDVCIARVLSDARNSPSLNIHQMSISYGYLSALSQSQYATDEQYYLSLASAGVTVFASSGDAGSTPDTSGGETGSLFAEYPAADPNVIGVGGTSLTLNSNGVASSETVWNNSIGATGGGIGTLPRPSWQVGTGVPTGTTRLVPDVAAAGDPNTGAEVVVSGKNKAYGGTSWSSPTWAGFCALLNQVHSNGTPSNSIGGLGPYLYPLLGTSSFRDITSGNNATSVSGGKYVAGTGYDMCTGLGVPNVQALANALSSNSNPPTVSGTPSNGVAGLAYNFAYSATYIGTISPTFSLASGALPTGISLSTSGALSGTPTQAGEFTGTINAANPGGTATVSFDIVISPGSQTITFPAIPDQLAGASVSLSATASSGLPVTYSFSGLATLTGNKLILNGPGAISVTAFQVGNTTFSAANSVTISFQVTAQSQKILFSSGSISQSQAVAGNTIVLASTTTAGLSVTYTVSGPATLNGYTLTLTGPGTVTITATQAGNGIYDAATPVTATFVVAPAGTTLDVFSGLALGGGWYYSAWFGTYNSNFYPWIYRTDIGFVYVSPTDNTNLYLYVVNGSPALGWLYTTSTLYPDVYGFSKNSWLYYGGGTDFYNYALGKWETY